MVNDGGLVNKVFERLLSFTRAISLAISFLCDKNILEKCFSLPNYPFWSDFFLSKNDVKVMFWTTKNSWHLKVILCWFKIDLDNYRRQVDFEKLLFKKKNLFRVHTWTTIKYLVQKWYFVTKIVLTYCNKKLFQWSRKSYEMKSWRPRICKFFEINRTIYSNSERSEQLLVTECFF